MIEQLLRLLFVGASAFAAWLFVYVLFSMLLQVMEWLYQRRKPMWLRMAEHSRVHLRPKQVESNQVARLALLILACGLALKAGLTGGILIALYLFVIGIALYLYLGQHAASLSREQISGSIGELVAAYYSGFLVMSTVFNALAEAAKTITNPQLQGAVQHSLDAFAAGRTTQQALDQLVSEVGDPYVAQFAFILQHTSESNQTEILAALQSLGKRLDQRQRLKDRSRVALALVSGTVRFLQSANGAVIALAVLVPFWWNFYASSISHQGLLMIGATIALVGSWYFENQLQQLRERVL